MNINLKECIDYIENTFLYGSQVTEKQIHNLVQKYSLSDSDLFVIREELESLRINVTASKNTYKDKIAALFEQVSTDKKISAHALKKWFDCEHITLDSQEKIKNVLTKEGVSIISTERQRLSLDDLGFLGDAQTKSLEETLRDQSFKKRVRDSKTPIDKEFNFDYLSDLSSEEDFEKKKEAMENLVRANKKLVMKCVKRYSGLATGSFDLSDMMMAGFQGLMKAAEKFDLSKDNQFSTYAVWWIRQSILREVYDFSLTIRVPVHMHETIDKVRRIERGYYEEHGQEISNQELSKALGKSEDQVQEYKSIQWRTNLRSLDVPIGIEKDSFLGDFIPDEMAASPEDQLLTKDLTKELKKSFEIALNDREAYVLQLRFGLTDGERYTLEQIGRNLGVSRERVRQIESKALKKLRSNRKLKLKEFLHDS